MDNPKFSIIVPVYNTGKYLERCINSVLTQRYSNFEVILVDDGSEKETADLCDAVEKQDPRIRVFHKENKGQLHTRLYGIKRSSGDYLMFLDSDDAFCENTLSTVKNYIDNFDFDFLCFGFQKVKEEKIIATSKKETTSPLVVRDKRELFLKVLSSSSYNSLWRKVIKSNGLWREGNDNNSLCRKDYSDFYHLRIAEDLIQSIDLYRNTKVAVFVNDILYNYYMIETSATHSVSYKKIKDSFIVHEEIEQFLKEEKIFSEADYETYHTMCWEILAGQVHSIAIADVTNCKKKQMFDNVKSEEYIHLLKGWQHGRVGFINEIILKLFWCSKYHQLITFCKMNSIAKQVLRKIRAR